MNIAQLERDYDVKKAEAKSAYEKMLATCKAEDREQTADDRAPVQALLAECTTLKGKIEQAKAGEGMLAEIDRLSLGQARSNAIVQPSAGDLRRQSMGQQFVQSASYDFFRKGKHRTSSAWRSDSVELIGGMHATTLTEDPASGGGLTMPQYLPGIIPTLFKPLTVADLFSQGTTTTNAIIYMVETLFTNAAAAVAEGIAKPESALTFAQVTEAVRKLATWLPVSEEMLEDVAQIMSYIDARLTLGVKQAEEDQLLNGNGTAPNLKGILQRSGLAAPVARVDPATNADVIYQQMMAIFTSSFVMPDGVVMNPTNWATTVLSKTTYGEYIAGGPFSPLPAATLWGLPVAVTPAIAAGTGLVGAFKQCGQVFRHGGIRVEASNSHQDFFVKNLVAIRAEERLALAVYRPGAFGKVTTLN
jgi:HK97 family phage major capsid protein